MNKYFFRRKEKQRRKLHAQGPHSRNSTSNTQACKAHPKPETANKQKTKAKKAIPHNQTKPKED
jgi:hypothetical protein